MSDPQESKPSNPEPSEEESRKARAARLRETISHMAKGEMGRPLSPRDFTEQAAAKAAGLAKKPGGAAPKGKQAGDSGS